MNLPIKKKHSHSSLLDPEENEEIFNLIESTSVSLSTAVIQLYHTEAPARAHWKKLGTGILCFIKDSKKRTYFFKMYCLKTNSLIWEHELYIEIELKYSQGYFIQIEGDKEMYGFNFADKNEAEHFLKTVTDVIKHRNRRSAKKNQNDELNKAIKLAMDKFNDKRNMRIVFTKHKRNTQKVIVDKSQISLPQDYIQFEHYGIDNTKMNKLLHEILTETNLIDFYETDENVKKSIDDYYQKVDVYNVEKNDLMSKNKLSKSTSNIPSRIAPKKPLGNSKIVDYAKNKLKKQKEVPGPPMPTIPAPIYRGETLNRPAPPTPINRPQPTIPITQSKSITPIISSTPPPPPPPPMPITDSKTDEIKNSQPISLSSQLKKQIQDGIVLKKIQSSNKTSNDIEPSSLKTSENKEKLNNIEDALRRAIMNRWNNMHPQSSDTSDTDDSDHEFDFDD